MDLSKLTNEKLLKIAKIKSKVRTDSMPLVEKGQERTSKNTREDTPTKKNSSEPISVLPKKRIVSFSAGKDSTAMVLKMIEKKIPFNELVFFDGGWEWSEIYKHVVDFEKYIGKKITILKPEHDFDWWMYNKPCAIGLGKGWPRFNLRWCTGVKQDTLRKYFKQQGEYITFIGFTADEKHRVPEREDSTKQYPLIDLGIEESQCLEICKSHGFDFGGLYKYMNSTSCWCCPLQPMRAVRALYKYFPEKWKKFREMSNKTKTPFKIGATIRDGIYVDDLEKKFKKEIEEGIFEEKLTKIYKSTGKSKKHGYFHKKNKRKNTYKESLDKIKKT